MKERYDHIIDDVYEQFFKNASSIKEGYECGDILGSQPHIDEMFSNPDKLIILTNEEFINKIKTDDEFAERWGLKIEERALSLEERIDLYIKKYNTIDASNFRQYEHTIPKRVITLTYNSETIEVFL